MLGEALDEGADDHDDGSAKDGPAATELVIDDGDKRQRENGAEGVGSGDDALEGALGISKVCFVSSPVSGPRLTLFLAAPVRSDSNHRGVETNVHFFQYGTICRALIIWESNADVHSIPMHVGNSIM